MLGRGGQRVWVLRGAAGSRDAPFLAFLRGLSPDDLRAFRGAFLARARRVENGCFEWKPIRPSAQLITGALTYGQRPNLRQIIAPRAAWLLFVGPIDPPSLHVRHLCHNSLCTDVEHLEPGTCSENRWDIHHAPAMAPRLRPMPVVLR